MHVVDWLHPALLLPCAAGLSPGQVRSSVGGTGRGLGLSGLFSINLENFFCL